MIEEYSTVETAVQGLGIPVVRPYREPEVDAGRFVLHHSLPTAKLSSSRIRLARPITGTGSQLVP